MFNQILVALKFGPASIHALKKALDLSQANDAKLHIFHALDYTYQNADENDPELVEVRKIAESRYRNRVEPLLSNSKNVTFKCRPADPALHICKLAYSLPADLIVLGCHQLTEKISMGRLDYVGVTILEKAPCPVMLVPFVDDG